MQLIKYFHELSLHPKNAKELKGLILQLAVQGKLTRDFRAVYPELREGSHSASALLEQIKAEKARLVKEKKIKKENPLPPISEEEIPYKVPEEWVWCRLGDYIHNFGQKQPDRKFTYVDVGSINNKEGVIKGNLNVLDSDEAPSRARKIVKKGCVIYSTVRPYLLNIAIIDKEFEHEPIVSTAFSVLNPLANCSPEYLFFFLRSETFIEYVEKLMIGVAYPAINDTNLMQGIVPVPPLPEQKAIVETVNQLFKEVEQLEQLTVERIQLKEQFAISALNQLATNNTIKEWAFLQEHFHSFFNYQPNIKKLRETILQLAVQGKLTTHFRIAHPELREGSHSAAALLEQIKAEKARLVKDKKIKKENPLPPITPEEIPYELPEGWVWCRMQNLVSLLGDGIHGTPEYSINSEYYFVNGNNLTDGVIEIKSNTKTVTEKEYIKHRRNLNENTILISINGTIGNTAFYNDEKVMLGKSACYFNLINGIDKYFIRQLLKSNYFLNYAFSSATGTTIKNVSLKTVRSFIVPLPSVHEQKAIVETVNRLMALCDQLEEEVLQSEKQVELMMKGVLREVLG